jgi:hypothetical protein
MKKLVKTLGVVGIVAGLGLMGKGLIDDEKDYKVLQSQTQEHLSENKFQKYNNLIEFGAGLTLFAAGFGALVYKKKDNKYDVPFEVTNPEKIKKE